MHTEGKIFGPSTFGASNPRAQKADTVDAVPARDRRTAVQGRGGMLDANLFPPEQVTIEAERGRQKALMNPLSLTPEHLNFPLIRLDQRPVCLRLDKFVSIHSRSHDPPR